MITSISGVTYTAALQGAQGLTDAKYELFLEVSEELGITQSFWMAGWCWMAPGFGNDSKMMVMFSLQSDYRRTLIWRAPGTRYHQENTIERYRYGGAGWLVWKGFILRIELRPACLEFNNDRPHLSGCHSGTTCTFVSGQNGC
ncbi:HTH_Tnp_Tc3_2 domain-containing protein [Trichonephila clavipes]|nr:HTH_Tnp_Tc3_2 domain-containing protein [Trichonephila clavipes]